MPHVFTRTEGAARQWQGPCLDRMLVMVQVRCSRALPAWQVAEASAQAVLPRGLEALLNPVVLGILAVLALAIAWIRKVLDTPSRKYNYEQPNVGAEYDAWTL